MTVFLSGWISDFGRIAGSHRRFRLLRGGAGMERAIESKTLAEFPDVAAQWHPTGNGNLTPTQVVAGSNRKDWW